MLESATSTLPDLESLAPYLGQISFGALAGFAAGYALKKVGKLLALAIGLLFIAIQVLAYFGFLSVNWNQVQATVDPLLEADSLNQGWHTLVSVLTINVPFALAFVPSLIIGLKRG